MVTIIGSNKIAEITNVDGVVVGLSYVELACLSTDTKPTANIATGSIAVEADTGKTFFFDGSDWVEQFSFQG